MSTPILSTKVSTKANAAVSGGVSGASELAARLQAQVRGMESQAAAPQSFASLLSQQGPAAQAPKAPQKSPERANAANDPAAKSQATARANEQAMTRVRQQAVIAQKQAAQAAELNQAAAKADAQPLTPSDSAAARGADSRSAERSNEPGTKLGMTDAERAPGEAASGDAESAIPMGDSASMMAWLAGVRPDAQRDLPTSAQALTDAAQDEAALIEQDLARLAGAELAPDEQAALGAEADGAMALDATQWQQTTSLADVQADALLGRARGAEVGTEALGAAGEAGGVNGLLAAGSARAGGLPPAQSVRHESAALPTPIDHPDFAQALADKMRLWVNTSRTDGPMTAELHLNPAEMGPIQVKIALEGQSAKVDFAAAAAETRKAIEASLTVLSSALSDVGLNLTGGGVSSQTAQQSFGQQSTPSNGARGASANTAGSSDAGVEVDGASMRGLNTSRAGRPGGLDLYA